MKEERLYYVDWLRILVILSLVPFHAALTYTGLGDTYIKSPLRDISVLPFVLINSSLGPFFMTLLFFVSGIATFYALKSRSKSEFMSERTKKLLIPLVLGMVFICPIQAYTKALYDGFKGSYLKFIPEFFSGKIVDYLGYSHLWYLLYLFVFSLILLPLFIKWKNNKMKLEKISLFLCKGKNIFIPIVFIVLTETLLRPFFPGKQTLIMDWANDIVYLSMIIFGFVFASDSKIQERLSRLKNISVTVVIICIIIFTTVDCDGIVGGTYFNNIYIAFTGAFLKGIYECAAIIMLLCIGRKYLNRKSFLLSYLNRASFTFYIIHFIPVSLLTYLFIRTALNTYLKYLLVVIVSYIFIFIVYELIVKRLLPLLKRKQSALN